MAQTFRQIEAVCPTCGVAKKINIPEELFIQKKFGTIKIQVPINAVCPHHQFIIFIDTKGIIRGYEKIDIEMAISPIETEKEAEGILTLRKLIQFFGMYGVFSLMHAKIFNYPSYIIKNENFIYTEDLINLIGNRLLPVKYQGTDNIYLLEKEDYNKIKLKEKEAFLIEAYKQHIFQTPWKEKLGFEEEIVKKDLEIINEEEQLLLLQQAITIFIKEAEYAKDILEDVKEIYEEDLIEQILRGVKSQKINRNRLLMIKEFIKRRFSEKLILKIKSKVEEFLSFI